MKRGAVRVSPKGVRVTGKADLYISSKELVFIRRKLTWIRLKSPSFQGFRPFVQLLYTLPVRLDMIERNILIVDGSPQLEAVDPRLEKTLNSRSPDVQEINEDIRQSHKIYHIQNCGTVYMPVDSFNARGVRMENCGNNVPQITCSLYFSPPFCSHLTWPYHIIQTTVLQILTMSKFYTHNLMQSQVVCRRLHHLPLNMLNMYSLL